MNNWVEFRHFRYLLAVVEHKGFRAAAEYLRTAEPNLSVQARQFQEAFAIQLFRRGKAGRIQLTKTAAAFKLIAQGLLDARDEAIAALIAIEQGRMRTLNLGCAPFVDPELFHVACELHKELLPNCAIRPTHGDAVQLVEELVSGQLDAALISLPIKDPRLRVVTIRRDRLVACLRKDHPLAAKTAMRPEDLQKHLAVLYDPQRHPGAHTRILELLGEVGVQIDEFSRVSHPIELQSLVKAGYGLALICEGTALEADLTTRPVAGVDWAVDTAFAYNGKLHPKTIPVLAGHLRRRLALHSIQGGGTKTMGSPNMTIGSGKRPAHSKCGDGRDHSNRRRFA
jgi:DNA-binding transcriptional LysR family regulator